MLLDRYGPKRVHGTLLVVAALGSTLFAASESFSMLLLGRALIGLGVAAALTAGVQALVLWFPKEKAPLLNGLMVMLGALGAVTATWPAEFLVTSIGWREVFGVLAALTAVCAIMVHFVVPETAPIPNKATSIGLKKVYTDPRFWRLAPLSASCIGTAWALQGLWAAQWLSDVDGLDRAGVVQHLFVMAVALSVGALGLGIAADRLRRRGIGPETLLGGVATVFIAIQVALILRLPLPSYLLWSGVAATGATTVLSYAVLADYFPKELTGRANGVLNLFHIAAAFVVQYATGLVVQQWFPDAGHYPEVAYQTALRSDPCRSDRGLDLVRDTADFSPSTGKLATAAVRNVSGSPHLSFDGHVRVTNFVGPDLRHPCNRARHDLGFNAMGRLEAWLPSSVGVPVV